MSLPRALQRIQETRSSRQGAAATALLQILAGESISHRKKQMISPLEQSLMESARQSGLVPETIHLLATHFEQLAKARRHILRGTIYPVVVVHLAVILLSLPTVFSPGGGIEAYLFQVATALGMVYFFLAAAWLGFRVVWALSCRSLLCEGLLRLVPVAGNLRTQWSAAQFSTTLSLFFQSAAGVLSALRPAAIAAQSPAAMRAAPRIAEAVRSGASLGEAVQMQGIFPTELVEAVFTGEETGRLGEELARCAQDFRARLADAIESLSLWLPRVLYALVVIYTGFRIVSMFGGYYQTMNDLMNP